MRVKLKDVKQGKTFWAVNVYVGREATTASVNRLFIRSRPFVSKHVKSLFVHVAAYGGTVQTSISLVDANVIRNGYNMHGLFTTQKSAQRHADLMIARCMSKSDWDFAYDRIRMNEEDDWSTDYPDALDYEDERDRDQDKDCDCAEDETYALPYNVKEGTCL